MASVSSLDAGTERSKAKRALVLSDEENIWTDLDSDKHLDADAEQDDKYLDWISAISTSSHSSLTRNPRLCALGSLPEEDEESDASPIQIPPSILSEASRNDIFDAALRRVEYNMYTLQFHDKSTQNRYILFQSRQQTTVIRAHLCIIFPIIGWFVEFTIELIDKRLHETNNIAFIIMILLFSITSIFLLLYGNHFYIMRSEDKGMIRQLQQFVEHARLNQVADCSDNDLSDVINNSANDDEAHRRTNRKSVRNLRRARILSYLGNICGLLICVSLSSYQVIATYYRTCTYYCVDGVPAGLMVILWYIPAHIVTFLVIDWSFLISYFLICDACLLASGIIAGWDHSSSGFWFCGLTAAANVIFFYSSLKYRICIFQQNDVLVNVVTEEERRLVAASARNINDLQIFM